MKSKISFFNKTIFWKNVTLYWPIWGIYTIVLLICQPVMLWMSCYNSQYYENYTYGDRLGDFSYVLGADFHDIFIAFMAVFAGMALFHYMYNHKSANMIHALPVDRTQLFCTNVLSGLTFLMVPQIFSGIITTIVALCNGIHEVHYVGIWLFMTFATDIIAMAIVTFCAMFTGHILALPVYVFIVSHLSYWVYYLVYIIVAMFGFGVHGLGIKEQKMAALFSPLESMVLNVGMYDEYNELGECIGIRVFGIEVLLVYLLFAVVLFAASYIIYKKRHIEQAGEFITVGWVKPVFRFGAAVTGGFFGGMVIREFLRSVGIGCNLPMYVLIMLVIGAIAYFVADMFIHKSFRVFKKKNWIGCGICSVLMVCTFFGLYGVAKSYEDYQPELEEIVSASVNMGYQIELEGEDVATILELHKEILANKEICIAADERNNEPYEYVGIYYTLKNGEDISRSYSLPIGYDEIDAIINKIAVMEQDVDNYLQFTFVKDYEQVEVFNGGWFEAQFYNQEDMDGDGMNDYTYDSVNVTSEQAKALYDAVIADAKAGTLMKYNVHSQWIREGNVEETWKYSESNLLIEFQAPNEEHDTQLLLEEYSFTYPSYDDYYIEIEDAESWYSAYITFGPDCENIVNKLIEFGLMESVDDIWWGEIDEYLTQ